MDIVGMLKGAVTDDVVQSASKAMGASPEQARGAIDASLPALLGGLLGQSGNAGAFGKIFDMIKGGGLAGQGEGLVKMLLGDKLGPLLSGLGGITGLASGGIGKLLAMLAPLLLGKLGEVAKAKGLDASGLAGLLQSQSGAIQAAIPQALKAPGAGLGDLFGAAKSAAGKAAPSAEAPSGGGMMVPLLLLVGLGLAAAWYFLKGGGAEVVDKAKDKAKEGIKAAGDAAKGAMDKGKEAVDGAKGALGSVKLPGVGDFALPEGPTGAVGKKLIDMLTAGKAGAPVALEGLKLSADGASVAPESAGLMAMVGKILNAFPALKLKLVGYLGGDKAPAMLKVVAEKLGLGDKLTVEAQKPGEGHAEGSFGLEIDK